VFHVKGAAGREVRPADLHSLAAGLAAFRGSVDAALAAVEADLSRARAALAEDVARQQKHAARANDVVAEVMRRGATEGGGGGLATLLGDGGDDGDQRGRIKHPKREA
jgi:hypothetical protein